MSSQVPFDPRSLNPRQLARLRKAVMIEKYRRDYSLYAREQLWIQTKTAGVVDHLILDKKPLQQMMAREMADQMKEFGYVDGNIIKGRQQGSSTGSQGAQFWKASLNRNYNTLLIAQDDPTTKSIFEKARFFYEHLDPWVKPLIRHSNRRELVFASPEHKKAVSDHGLGSRMDFTAATNMMAGTGTTRQGLHLSECAKYRDEDVQILVSSVYPCVNQGTGTIRIKESTPFVGGKWFREVCDTAREAKQQKLDGKKPIVNEFFIFAPWYLEPDYRRGLHPKFDKDLMRMKGLDIEEKRIVAVAKRGQPKDGVPPFEVSPEQLAWRRWQISQPGFDENIFLQEYPTDYESCWISFDSRVFNHEKLYGMRPQLKQPLYMAQVEPGPKIIEDPNMRMQEDLSYIAFWEEPIPGEDYDIGVDCSAGIEGGDWQAAVVWKRRNREQVAEMHIHVDGSDYGTKLFWLGLWYNSAQIAVEWTGGYGVAPEQQLKRLNYPNLYLWRHRDQAVPIPTRKTGWQTTRESKAVLVSMFRHFVNRNDVIIRSRILLNELFAFIQIPWGDGYDYRAEHGHDDLVMAGGIGLVISDDENFGRLSEANVVTTHSPPRGDIAVVDSYDPKSPPRSTHFFSEVHGRG